MREVWTTAKTIQPLRTQGIVSRTGNSKPIIKAFLKMGKKRKKRGILCKFLPLWAGELHWVRPHQHHISERQILNEEVVSDVNEHWRNIFRITRCILTRHYILNIMNTFVFFYLQEEFALQMKHRMYFLVIFQKEDFTLVKYFM